MDRSCSSLRRDPFGKVLHEEVLPNGKHAGRRVEEFKREIRSGKLGSLPS